MKTTVLVWVLAATTTTTTTTMMMMKAFQYNTVTPTFDNYDEIENHDNRVAHGSIASAFVHGIYCPSCADCIHANACHGCNNNGNVE